MKKMWIIIGAAIVVVAIIVAVVLGMGKSGTPATTTTSPGTSGATITYSSSGFSPATITVKSGDTVTVKNDSSSMLQFDSGPHPTHTDDPDLNIGEISQGQTKTFTVTQKGTFSYHNHFAAGDMGQIVIE